MEETLGKRISAGRKRLGLTQDALADKLGVTAQAVSKWENDQSCPDITMLPKLAELFDTTTDALLGVEKQTVHTAEIVSEPSPEKEPEGLHMEKNGLEIQWGGGRRSNIAFACWVLLIGGILVASRLGWPAPYFSYTLWDLLWTTALLVFGISGLLRRFSVFRFGCTFFGTYFLLERGGLLREDKLTSLLFPIILLMLGVGLLLDALHKPNKRGFHISHNGNHIHNGGLKMEADSFSCETCFGENDYLINLPRLSRGTAEVSFGQMTVDLSGCEEVAEGCQLNLNCSFGQLTVLVPRQYRTKIDPSAAFGNVEEKGVADPTAAGLITLSCDASFGQITIRHI